MTTREEREATATQVYLEQRDKERAARHNLSKIRVLVCGGREYSNREALFKAMDGLDWEICFLTVIHGACRGADTLAGEWAEHRERAVEDYPILAGEGGYARNERMLRESKPDLVVHFPGGNGTRHMVRIAGEAGVPTHGGLAGPMYREPRLL